MKREERLMDKLNAAGMNKRRLAEELNVNPSAITLAANGTRKSWDLWERIADYFDVPMGYFIDADSQYLAQYYQLDEVKEENVSYATKLIDDTNLKKKISELETRLKQLEENKQSK